MAKPLLLLVSAAVCCLSARAAVFNYSLSVDLSAVQITPDSAGGKLIFGYPDTAASIGSPFTPAAGDEIITSVTFLNHDLLRITGGASVVDSTGPTYFAGLNFYFGDSAGFPPGYRSHTTSLSFSDAVGTPLSAYNVDGLLGPAMIGFLSAGESFAFSGFTATTVVDYVPGDGGEMAQFGMWGGRAGNFEVIPGAPAAVPEGSNTFALCGLACAALQLLWRKITA